MSSIRITFPAVFLPEAKRTLRPGRQHFYPRDSGKVKKATNETKTFFPSSLSDVVLHNDLKVRFRLDSGTRAHEDTVILEYYNTCFFFVFSRRIGKELIASHWRPTRCHVLGDYAYAVVVKTYEYVFTGP